MLRGVGKIVSSADVYHLFFNIIFYKPGQNRKALRVMQGTPLVVWNNNGCLALLRKIGARHGERGTL